MNGFTPFQTDVTAGLLALVGNPKKAEEVLKGLYKEQEVLEKQLAENNRVLAKVAEAQKEITKQRAEVDADLEALKNGRKAIEKDRQANITARAENEKQMRDIKDERNSLSASHDELDRRAKELGKRLAAVRADEDRIAQLKSDTEAALADAAALKAAFEEKLTQMRQIAK